MKIKYYILTLCLLMNATIILLAGCGGGTGGASGTTIVISSPSADTLKSGQSVSGSVTITTSDGSALNNVALDIKTDNANVIGTSTKTDSGGVAGYTLTASSNVSSTQVVKVWAEYKGLKSNYVSLTLSSAADSSTFDFTIGTTADYSRTVAVGAASGLANIVVVGNSVKFIGPNGETNTPIVISVDSIDNYIAGDNVRINLQDFNGALPAGTMTLTPDSFGIALIPTTYTVYLPAAGATGDTTSHVYAVTWRASVTLNGVTYTKTTQTLVTGTTVTQ